MNTFATEQSAYSKEVVGSTFWRGTAGARKIFEKRCRNANLPYFHPHSFRHLVVNILSKTRLTEEEKRAISLNLGHANAVKIVQKLTTSQKTDGAGASTLSSEEKAVLERLIGRS
jgi:hypothetical protein